MNEELMLEQDARAGDELTRQMARYARVRLDPSPAATRRARQAVMVEAWRRHLEVEVSSRPRRRGPFTSWTARRLGASIAAALVAGLLLGS